MAVSAAAATTIEIQPIETRTIYLAIKGTRPMIQNRLAEKAKQELLMPKGRKTTAERASSLKHNPVEEFRSSPYTIQDDDAPTLLAFPVAAFKKGMMAAALRIPGVKKTEIAQLLWVEGDLAPIYGKPELLMSVTRSADMNRTPDIRTRAIVPEWVTSIAITYTVPILNEQSVVNLIAAAGQLCGIGDWRPEKGAGTFGQYVLTNEDDADYQRVMAEGGRDAQIEALASPITHNAETDELWTWFASESKARGKVA